MTKFLDSFLKLRLHVWSTKIRGQNTDFRHRRSSKVNGRLAEIVFYHWSNVRLSSQNIVFNNELCHHFYYRQLCKCSILIEAGFLARLNFPVSAQYVLLVRHNRNIMILCLKLDSY